MIVGVNPIRNDEKQLTVFNHAIPVIFTWEPLDSHVTSDPGPRDAPQMSEGHLLGSDFHGSHVEFVGVHVFFPESHGFFEVSKCFL